MTGTGVESGVRLEPWSADDLWLLRRLNTPGMTEHVGGPETEEQLTARHRRYLDVEAGRMHRVVLAGTGETVGSIGYWERDRQSETVWETGWGVLPEFQRRGLAVLAAREVIAVARDANTHRHLHALPRVENAASNAVCRRAGFTLLGEVSAEYPKGHWSKSNDWRWDLKQD
ncbi:GNAT family N-acetyltransferase [Streptomyces europaeiscabiei]|uniref:GNAT family N-acetyltransferase n=1 Tax=Streptomyces europaeiscabiei TaxID=146819 RepID=UPI0029B94023|nr:GNAT family N-acetyltransferase [Streptomyces europaeiscabiei]MDX3619345.1 GNAT family N-acetyltransferase [Streptomyces europaeiscabiei]WUD37359.1 GNAT family N-acetyltransferase [Streptomyces europaeiscabiei]